MNDVWSTAGAFALGGVGWLTVSFIGAPFRKFFDLRSEVIYKSVVYANVAAREKQSPDGTTEILERSEDEIERLHEAQDTFRDLAAQMGALALNEPLAMLLVRARGYD